MLVVLITFWGIFFNKDIKDETLVLVHRGSVIYYIDPKYSTHTPLPDRQANKKKKKTQIKHYVRDAELLWNEQLLTPNCPVSRLRS